MWTDRFLQDVYVYRLGECILNEKTMKEIMLICKGWYNEDKYTSVLEALNAYYHKNYCNDVMDKELALSLFLQPLATEAIKRKPELVSYLFKNSFGVTENAEPFVDVLYKRMLTLIRMIDNSVFDTSEYDQMMEKIRANGHEYTSIGII